MTLLLHVLAYNGHLQGGGYQRQAYLWVIVLEMCRYKAETHVLNKLHEKMLQVTNILSCNLFNTCILAFYLHISNIVTHN
jgi:hypothetical protein